MAISNVLLAKHVLSENSKVLYGIFGIIETSGYFPPLRFLNEFFMVGYDPCDQDGRMASWRQFSLTENEYKEIAAWWFSLHPGATESDLGAECWDDWLQIILEN